MSRLQQRLDRLASDHREMTNLLGPTVAWRALSGTPPHVDRYELTLQVRSPVFSERGSDPAYRDTHVITVSLPPGYPFGGVLPVAEMTSRPLAFNPNWWPGGSYCPGRGSTFEGLGEYVVRMIRVLRYEEAALNPGSPANSQAKDWFLRHRLSRLFPTDTRPLPDPARSAFKVTDTRASRFVVNSTRGA